MSATGNLMKLSFNLDESQLLRFIQASIGKANEKIERELVTIQKSINSLRDDHASLKQEIADVKDQDIPQLYDYLHELKQTTVRRKSTAITGPSSVTNITLQPPTMTPRGVHVDEPSPQTAPAPPQESSREEPPPQDDAIQTVVEMIDAVSEKLARCQEDIDRCNKNSVADKISTTEELDSITSQVGNLLTFLGLEFNATYGGVIKSGSLASNLFLQEVEELITQSGNRLSAIEGSLKTKCAKQELETVVFNVTDLRGFCESAVNRLDDQRESLGKAIEGMDKEFEAKVETRVPWTELELWKASVNEAMLKTRDACVDATRKVAEMEEDMLAVKEVAAHGGAGSVNMAQSGFAQSVRTPFESSRRRPSATPVHDGSGVSIGQGSHLGVAAGSSAAAAKDLRDKDPANQTHSSADGDNSKRYITYAEVTPSSDLRINVVNHGIQRIAGAIEKSNKRPASAGFKRSM